MTTTVSSGKNDYLQATVFALVLLTVMPTLINLTAPGGDIKDVYRDTFIVAFCAFLFLKWDGNNRLPRRLSRTAAIIGILFWLKLQINFFNWLGWINF